MAPDPLVLHVLEAVEGGTARHLTDVVTYTEGVSHMVVLPSRRVGGVTDLQAQPAIERTGARVVNLDMRRSPASGHNVIALVKLRKLIRGLRPDVVHGHSTIGGALSRIAAAGHARRLYTPNGFNPSPIVRAAERSLDPLTDVLIAVSASEAEALQRAGLGRRGRIVTIPNGIDLSPPDAGPTPNLRTMLGLAAGVPLVGTIARLVPQKAPERFVEVGARIVARHPDVHLVLIGSGGLERRVERRVDELGIRAQFHRVPALPDAYRILDQLSVFVLTSRFEGGAYTPLEAMRAGVPVMLSDAVGNRDLVVDGRSGRIVNGDDTEGMAAAVIALLDNPRAGAAMAAEAHLELTRRFDVRTMGASLSRLYAEALR